MYIIQMEVNIPLAKHYPGELLQLETYNLLL